jgi:hypothetical protein
MAAPIVSIDRLRLVLSYDKTTGVFERLIKVNRNSVIGEEVGSVNRVNGYRYIRIDGRAYLHHRLAWFYVHGQWPDDQIDHIDGNRLNNSVVNLRPASSKQNRENRELSTSNKTGYRGVFYRKDKDKYRASVKHNGKSQHLGYFNTAEEAAVVAKNARARLFTHDHGRGDTFAGRLLEVLGTVEALAPAIHDHLLPGR